MTATCHRPRGARFPPLLRWQLVSKKAPGQNACPPEDVGGVGGYALSSRHWLSPPTRRTTALSSGSVTNSTQTSSSSTPRCSGFADLAAAPVPGVGRDTPG